MSARWLGEERGSSLAGVLLITTLAGMLAAGLLALAIGHGHETSRRQDSIEAFFAAEVGIESGKLAFEKANQVFGIPRVTGTIDGSTFEVRPGVGNFGDEAWSQWSYDEGASRKNTRSLIGPNLRPGWMTMKSPARNGATIGSSFYVTNIFTVVGSGLIYVSYENPSDGRIHIAAFDELDGSLQWTTEGTSLLGTGLRLTAPALVEETNTLYVCLTSDSSEEGTVRLVALNVNRSGVSLKWEYDTGMHGIATPPAVYNPNWDAGGEEIVYFGVVETPDWNLLSLSQGQRLPYRYDDPEGVYLFAVRDEGDQPRDKWLHPFPDPEIAARTDYPTEYWRYVSGPVDRTSMVAPFPPDDDLVVDYLNRYGTDFAVRGDVYILFDPHSLGAPVLHVDDAGTPTDPRDDVVDVYLYYTVVIDKDTYYAAYGNSIPSRRYIRWQAEVAAVRDRADSRFAELKWTANPPPHDPNDADGIAADGYESDNWDTFFEQQVSPMVGRTTLEPDLTTRPDHDGDTTPDEVSAIYVPYESLGYASSGAYYNSDDRAVSRGMLASFLDTYDQWVEGVSTGPDGGSRPVEFFWRDDGDEGPFTRAPYVWDERDLDATGELGVTPFVGTSRSADLDVEGETMAYDADAGLLYFVFNHDLYPTSADFESLRVHAVNATTGDEVWQQAVAARLAGDAFNATPSLSGGYLFMFEIAPGTRTARLNIFNGNDGAPTDSSPITVDTDADGANIAPTIANDVCYVGTYDRFALEQRVFALSPNVWLISTGHSPNGKAHRTVALLESDGALTGWREGGFSGGGPGDE